METTLRYLAASTNRHGHAAAMSHEQSIVAFASHKVVVLWKLSQGKNTIIHDTLVGYAGEVTCVRFAFARDDLIIAGDDQGWLYLHHLENGSWQLAAKAQAHLHSIAALCDRQGIIVTGSSDATIKIWAVDETNSMLNLKHHQTIQTGGRFPLDCQIAQLPGVSNYILAVASTDRILRIYIHSDGQFIQALTLSGHEDWIRALAFSSVGSSQPLLLASGSQDGTIRLWSITPAEGITAMAPLGSSDFSAELLNAFEASLGDMADEEGGRQISTKRHVLAVKDGESLRQFQVEFDALLIGHEASVTSLSWRPDRSPSSTPMLLSTSVDSSVILWAPETFRAGAIEQDATLWVNKQRFGDVGGQRLGGFVGGMWAVGGTDVMAWGWNGGWRRWTCSMGEPETWVEVPAFTGHAGPVHGLNWSPNGDYLITTSLDQTTRIHGEAGDQGWHELSRPQIHGYDCLDARFITQSRFVSIADEKVARVFDAPKRFVDTLTGLHVSKFEESRDRPETATLPPLGLSNKAAQSDGDESKPNDDPPTMRLPFESELATATLWPEIEKIFGHGYETIALAVSNTGSLMATACKSTTPEHALIRLYDTESFLPYGEPLSGHSLTVVRIAFNRDDRLILSVSKDRTWCLFERTENGYTLRCTAKAHARIIWDCVWMHEEDVFVTAGRDKQVKVWATDTGSYDFKCVATLKVSGAATAVAVSKMDEDGQRLLAVGLETGEILIYSSKSHNNWGVSYRVPSNESPVDHVRVLAWRERKVVDGTIERHLATCSDDRSVRVIQILSTRSE